MLFCLNCNKSFVVSVELKGESYLLGSGGECFEELRRKEGVKGEQRSEKVGGEEAVDAGSLKRGFGVESRADRELQKRSGSFAVAVAELIFESDNGNLVEGTDAGIVEAEP